MERCRIESFESMPLFFQDPAALIFKVAGLHRMLANKQNAGLVIELDTKIGVPLSPKRNAAIGQGRVIFVRSVSGADRFADIGRSSEWMGQGTLINKDDLVAACF